MNAIEIAVVIIVGALFLAAVSYLVVRKLRHKGGCDCGGSCSGCSGCSDKSRSAESDGGKHCPHCK